MASIQKYLFNANDVAIILNCSKSRAYNVIHELNEELLGFTNVRDAESEFGRMRTVMSAYESKVEDALWAKEKLEKDVQYYMKNLDSIESDARDIDMERRKVLSR